jgi:hypothetical protein
LTNRLFIERNILKILNITDDIDMHISNIISNKDEINLNIVFITEPIILKNLFIFTHCVSDFLMYSRLFIYCSLKGHYIIHIFLQLYTLSQLKHKKVSSDVFIASILLHIGHVDLCKGYNFRHLG